MPIDTAQTLYEYKDKLEKYKIKQIKKEELLLNSKNIISKLACVDNELIQLEIELDKLKYLLKL